MGCDIHGVIQVLDPQTKKWKTVAEGYPHRNYDAFAILANVRNGYGFAGVQTGEGFEFISEPRGFPSDFLHNDYEHPLPGDFQWWPEGYRKESGEERGSYYLGDHSSSYVSADELINGVNWDATMIQYGVLSQAAYEAWDKKSCPQAYCGAAWGKDLVTFEEPDYLHLKACGDLPGDKQISVRASWQETYRESVGKEFHEKFFGMLREWGEKVGGLENVRFVFNFDS